jgi:hypothetical protein
MKIAVYTANIGGCIKLYEPKILENNVDYIYFTDDKNLKSDKWNIVYVENTIETTDVSPGNRSLAKRIKMLFWEYLIEYDWVVWIDAQNQILSDGFRSYIDTIPSTIDAVFKPNPKPRDVGPRKRRTKTNVYEEIRVCKFFNLDNPEELDIWETELKNMNFPSYEYGLFETNIIFRRCNFENIPKDFYQEWWDLSTNRFRRDQLTINYLIWKYDIKEYVLDDKLDDIISTYKDENGRTDKGTAERNGNF